MVNKMNIITHMFRSRQRYHSRRSACLESDDFNEKHNTSKYNTYLTVLT